jgi:predicted methyltransferase
MENITLEKILDNSKIIVDGLKENLVSRVDPAEISLKAKIPTKVVIIREALLYRATDLAESSIFLLRDENLVSGACTIRAFQETVAIMFFINKKVKKAIRDKDVQHLDDALMKALVGSKVNENLPTPTNILTMIDKVDMEIETFRGTYD